MTKMNVKTLFLLLMVLSLTINGCAKSMEDSSAVVAKVNKDLVRASEISRSIALKLRSNPTTEVTQELLDRELESILNKRLLIQQAKKMKLDQTKLFQDTIQSFWEQTLIRDLIIAKSDDFQDKIKVSKKEVDKYYKRLEFKCTFKVLTDKDKKTLKKASKDQTDAITWSDTIGPISYEEATAPSIKELFDLKEGEDKIIEDTDRYHLVRLVKKEVLPLPSRANIESSIRKQIETDKKALLLKEWLDRIRSKAKIDIDNAALSSIISESDSDGE